MLGSWGKVRLLVGLVQSANDEATGAIVQCPEVQDSLPLIALAAFAGVSGQLGISEKSRRVFSKLNLRRTYGF